MGSYRVTTRLDEQDVLTRARAFFGLGGVGLEATVSGDNCLRFMGGSGHVQVEVKRDGLQTEVDLETREWDHQVREFMHELSRH
jgi:hypothetical protein